MSYLLLICVSFLSVCCFLFRSQNMYTVVLLIGNTLTGYVWGWDNKTQQPCSILSGVKNLERASQVKVETVRALNMSINSLAVLLDNINNIFGWQLYYSWKVSKLCIFFNYYSVVLNLEGERGGAPIV